MVGGYKSKFFKGLGKYLNSRSSWLSFFELGHMDPYSTFLTLTKNILDDFFLFFGIEGFCYPRSILCFSINRSALVYSYMDLIIKRGSNDGFKDLILVILWLTGKTYIDLGKITASFFGEVSFTTICCCFCIYVVCHNRRLCLGGDYYSYNVNESPPKTLLIDVKLRLYRGLIV